MRIKVILVTVGLLIAVILGVGVAWFIPYYQALYYFPAIRYDNRLYLPTKAEEGVRRYTDGENKVSLKTTTSGTQMTLELADHVPADFLIVEQGKLISASYADYTGTLTGIWQDGKLTDAQTGYVHELYTFQIMYDSPNPALALALYEAEKGGVRGKPGVKHWILIWFLASIAGLFRLAFPGPAYQKKILQKSPMLFKAYLIFFCVFPFAAIPVILYMAVT